MGEDITDQDAEKAWKECESLLTKNPSSILKFPSDEPSVTEADWVNFLLAHLRFRWNWWKLFSENTAVADIDKFSNACLQQLLKLPFSAPWAAKVPENTIDLKASKRMNSLLPSRTVKIPTLTETSQLWTITLQKLVQLSTFSTTLQNYLSPSHNYQGLGPIEQVFAFLNRFTEYPSPTGPIYNCKVFSSLSPFIQNINTILQTALKNFGIPPIILDLKELPDIIQRMGKVQN
jgi:hypothetical protein